MAIFYDPIPNTYVMSTSTNMTLELDSIYIFLAPKGAYEVQILLVGLSVCLSCHIML